MLTPEGSRVGKTVILNSANIDISDGFCRMCLSMESMFPIFYVFKVWFLMGPNQKKAHLKTLRTLSQPSNTPVTLTTHSQKPTFKHKTAVPNNLTYLYDALWCSAGRLMCYMAGSERG